jgi:hypothetical protein
MITDRELLARALEALGRETKNDSELDSRTDALMDDIYARLAQLDTEPVVWMLETSAGTELSLHLYDDGITDDWVPLYTHPAPPVWRPVTEQLPKPGAAPAK